MRINLNGRAALVVGGTRGLGAGIARILAQAGARVGVTSRSEQDARSAADTLNRDLDTDRVIGLAMDVNDVAGVNRGVAAYHGWAERLDILVNCAGVALTCEAARITEADWDMVLDTNLKGTFFTCQAAFGYMCGNGGRIINIASALGLVAGGSVASYCASKAGIIHLTRALAYEWAQHNITVNSIAPGYVLTDMNREILSKPAVQQRLVAQTPLQRLGQVEDVAQAVAFLADPDNTFMTGQVVVVDGGWTIH